MQEGILTAGHVALDALAYPLTLYLETGATCPVYYDSSNSAIQFSDNDFGDYAFLPANGNTLTNKIQSSSWTMISVTAAYTDEFSDELEGTYVNKYGASTGITHGQLEGMVCPSYTFPSFQTFTIKRLWEVKDTGYSTNNPIATWGDSGAPVWQTVSGVQTIMGILSGGPSSGSDAGIVYYFTPFDTMQWGSLNPMDYGDDFVLRLYS